MHPCVIGGMEHGESLPAPLKGKHLSPVKQLWRPWRPSAGRASPLCRTHPVAVPERLPTQQPAPPAAASNVVLHIKCK